MTVHPDSGACTGLHPINEPHLGVCPAVSFTRRLRCMHGRCTALYHGSLLKVHTDHCCDESPRMRERASADMRGTTFLVTVQQENSCDRVMLSPCLLLLNRFSLVRTTSEFRVFVVCTSPQNLFKIFLDECFVYIRGFALADTEYIISTHGIYHFMLPCGTALRGRVFAHYTFQKMQVRAVSVQELVANRIIE